MIFYIFGKRFEYKFEIYLKIKFNLKMIEKKDFWEKFLYCNILCIYESKCFCGNWIWELNIGELKLYLLCLRKFGDMNCFIIFKLICCNVLL